MIAAKYVAKTTGLAITGTTVVLLAVHGIFQYLEELGALRDNYTAIDALIYTLWNIPEYLYGLLPMCSLLGVVIGLSILANTSELVVLRATGISIWKIIKWATVPLFLYAVLSLILSQWVIPTTSLQAQMLKTNNRTEKTAEIAGFWNKVNHQFIYVNYASNTGQITQTQILEIDDHHRLKHIITANTANSVGDTTWQLEKQKNIIIEPSGAMKEQTNMAAATVNLGIDAHFLHLVTLQPEQLSPFQLYKLLSRMKQYGTHSQNYALIFWQKTFMPFTMFALAVLACSFVFGSLRQTSTGVRLVTALFVGLGFRYAQDLFGYLSLMYEISPFWFVLLPVLAVFALGYFAVRRAS